MGSNTAHCCSSLAGTIEPEFAQHPDPKDCEDALVTYDSRYDRYALLARFGSPWVTVVNFCSWRRDPKRDLSEQYYGELGAPGVDYPDDEPPSGSSRIAGGVRENCDKTCERKRNDQWKLNI